MGCRSLKAASWLGRNRVSKVDYIETGSGPTVMFLHGIGGRAFGFEYQLPFFAQAGFHAVAWDMPGYGQSDSLQDMTFPALADALLRLVDDLGVDTVHVVGHSIGAMVVQEFARHYQHRLATMVLAQTSPAFGNPSGDFQKKFVADRLRPLQEGKTMADIAEDVIPELMAAGASGDALALAKDCMNQITPDTYSAAMQCIVTFEGRDNLPKITLPTLVLAGDQDRNAPAPMMEKMASKIPGAEYVLLTDTGHLAPIENAQEFNSSVLEFVQRHQPGLES